MLQADGANLVMILATEPKKVGEAHALLPPGCRVSQRFVPALKNIFDPYEAIILFGSPQEAAFTSATLRGLQRASALGRTIFVTPKPDQILYPWPLKRLMGSDLLKDELPKELGELLFGTPRLRCRAVFDTTLGPDVSACARDLLDAAFREKKPPGPLQELGKVAGYSPLAVRALHLSLPGFTDLMTDAARVSWWLERRSAKCLEGDVAAELGISIPTLWRACRRLAGQGPRATRIGDLLRRLRQRIRQC